MYNRADYCKRKLDFDSESLSCPAERFGRTAESICFEIGRSNRRPKSGRLDSRPKCAEITQGSKENSLEPYLLGKSDVRYNTLAPRRPVYSLEQFEHLQELSDPQKYAKYLLTITREEQDLAKPAAIGPPKISLFEVMRTQSYNVYTSEIEETQRHVAPRRLMSSMFLRSDSQGLQNWITAFGFPFSETERLLNSCFRLVGEIQQKYWHSGALQLQYQNNLECRRALEFDSLIVCGYCLRVVRTTAADLLPMQPSPEATTEPKWRHCTRFANLLPRRKRERRYGNWIDVPKRWLDTYVGPRNWRGNSLFQRIEKKLESILFNTTDWCD